MVSYHFDQTSNSNDSAPNWLTNRNQVDIYGFSQHDTVKEFGDEWSTVRSHTVQYSKTNERIHHSLNNTETVILIFSMVFHTSKTIKMFVRHILTSWSYPQYSCFSKFYPTLGRLWRASIQVLIPKKIRILKGIKNRWI